MLAHKFIFVLLLHEHKCLMVVVLCIISDGVASLDIIQSQQILLDYINLYTNNISDVEI